MTQFDTFTRFTGINVVECPSIRDFNDLPVSSQYKIENGRLFGWFDKETRTVKVYTGRASWDHQVNNQRLATSVLNLSLANLGWENLFLPARKKGAIEALKLFIESEGAFHLQPLLEFDKVNIVETRNEWNMDYRLGEELSTFLCRYFQLPASETIGKSIQIAMTVGLSSKIDREKNAGNVEVIASDLKIALNDPAHHKYFNVGARPRALMRAGYSEMPIVIPIEKIQAIQKESKLSIKEFASAFAKEIRNPLAVLESSFMSKSNELQYIVVLDITNPSERKATLIIDRPEKIADGLKKNQISFISPRSSYWISNNQIAYLINHNKAKNLREKSFEGSREFDIIQEIYKNEPGPSTVRNSASVSPALKIDSKIVQNYHNSKYYTENFSKYEELMALDDQIKKKAAEVAPPSDERRPSQKDTRSVQERMGTFVASISSLTEKEIKTLNEMKIRTLGELRNATPAILSRKFTKRQITAFEQALESNGLSFYSRQKAITPEEFAKFNDKVKSDKAKEDFAIAVQYLQEEKLEGVDIPFPTHLDHSLFSGVASFHMFVKLSSRHQKWNWAPVFISAEEMKELGLSASPSADPIHVSEGDVWKSYYNIMDTNLQEMHPERFAKEVEFMDNECVCGLTYPAVALSTIFDFKKNAGPVAKGPETLANLKREAGRMLTFFGRRFDEEIGKEVNANFSIGRPKNTDEVNSEEYKLATEMTMFLAYNLRKHGIDTVIISQEGAKIEVNSNEFRLSDGTVYGFTKAGTIYLTPDGINPNTPIHEYAHLWANVLQRIQPEEWKALKEELRNTPLWEQISSSEEYAFIGKDDDRLAGEVLATLVGNKGEELMLKAASETIADSQGDKAKDIRAGIERFRNDLGTMVARDVFDVEGLDVTGATTLKVLRDFAEGKGVRLTADEGEKLAAMREISVHANNRTSPAIDIPNGSKQKLTDNLNFIKFEDGSGILVDDAGNHIKSPLDNYEFVQGVIPLDRNLNKNFSVPVGTHADVKCFAYKCTNYAMQNNPVYGVFAENGEIIFPYYDLDDMDKIYNAKTLNEFVASMELATKREISNDTNQSKNSNKGKNMETKESTRVIKYEHIMPGRVLPGSMDRAVPIHSPSALTDDAALLGNIDNGGRRFVMIRGKEPHEVPEEGVFVVGKEGAYEVLTEKQFNEKYVRGVIDSKATSLVFDQYCLSRTDWGLYCNVTSKEQNIRACGTKEWREFFKLIDENIARGRDILYNGPKKDSVNTAKTKDNGAIKYEHIMPGRVLPGTKEVNVPIYNSSALTDDAVLLGNIDEGGRRFVMIRGKEPHEVPKEGLFIVGKNGAYDILTEKQFNEKYIRNATGDTTVTLREEINREQIKNLSLDDKMAMISFYAVDGSSRIASENDKVAIMRASKSISDTPSEIPEVDEDVIRQSLNENLNATFDKLSSATLLEMTKNVNIQVATAFHSSIPARSNTLLSLHNDKGTRMLNSLYRKNLEFNGFEALTLDDIKNRLHDLATGADAIIIVDNKSQSLEQQLEYLSKTNQIRPGDKVFLRINNAISFCEVSELKQNPDSGYSLKPSTFSVRLREDGTIETVSMKPNESKKSVEYSFAHGGMLLCAEIKPEPISPAPAIKEPFDTKTTTPAHAVKELLEQVKIALPKMDVLEITGLQQEIAELWDPISSFISYSLDENLSKSTKYQIDDVQDSIHKLTKVVSDYKEKAVSEFLQYAKRGFRTNNTLIDRITGRTFEQTVPLPSMESINKDGSQDKKGSVTVQQIGEGKIPIDFYKAFVSRCESTNNLGFNIDFFPLSGQDMALEPIKADTKIVPIAELESVLKEYGRQLDLCGRINEPILAPSGEYLLVQKDGENLITIDPAVAKDVMMSHMFDGKVRVDGVDYRLDYESFRSIASGTGQWLSPVNGGDPAYIVFDLKSQCPVRAGNYESAVRKFARKSSRTYEEKLGQGLQQKKSKEKSGPSKGLR